MESVAVTVAPVVLDHQLIHLGVLQLVLGKILVALITTQAVVAAVTTQAAHLQVVLVAAVMDQTHHQLQEQQTQVAAAAVHITRQANQVDQVL
jgi:hypothetical protein